MKILLENLGGASSQPSTLQHSVEDTQMVKKGKVSNESDSSEGMLNSVAIQVYGQDCVQFQHVGLKQCK